MTFPYTGWVLSHDFKPQKKVFVSSFDGTAYHVTKNGMTAHSMFIYESAEEAVLRGTGLLNERQAAIDKKQQTINQYRKNLESVEP